MIRIKDTRYPHTAAFLAGAIRTAEYYGFVPVESLKKQRVPAFNANRRDTELLFARKDERALVHAAKNCVTCVRSPQEVILAWRLNATPNREKGSLPAQTLELHVIGAPHAFAEALLIVVANAIASDAGISSPTLYINSIGSHESSNRFIRDVGTFLRKHLESISPALRPRAATDPLGTLIQLFEKGHPAMSRAPQAMEYLTEDERRRFWDLLEYLEVFGIPYELSPRVLGSRDFWAHTLFELALRDQETDTVVPFAFGGRYDPLASRVMSNITPAATVSIMFETKGKVALKDLERPLAALYFAHLGLEARRRSFSVLETLRRARIPVHQSLMNERLGDQMEHARKKKVSHLLIMGHKEALEGTVLVREVATNAQESVPVVELPSYLRRYRLPETV